MVRTLIWMAIGAVLGGIIHLIVILTLPMMARDTIWDRVTALDAHHRMQVLPVPAPGEPNPFGLDPDLTYAVCQVDLGDEPVYLKGTLPDAFWSLAIFNQAGIVTYSTTNRDGIGQTVDIGIFNAAQTRLLARQEIDISEGVMVVESTTDQFFALLRLAPPQPAMRARFEQALGAISCGPQPTP